MTSSQPPASGTTTARPPADADELLGLFLRAVSHDLKTPLLTLSLTAELLADMLPEGERARVARDGLIHGVRDMERMLDAVTAISRARSRALDAGPARLSDLLAGRVVLCDDEAAQQAAVAVDPRPITELLTAAAGDHPAEVRLDLRDGAAHLELLLPESLPAVDASPLHALVTSLQQCAGSAVVLLATAQVQIERQGGRVDVEDGRLLVQLPLVGAAR